MQTKFLLPHRAKRWGWILAIPSFVLMLVVLQNDFSFPFLDFHLSGLKHINFDNGFLFNIQFNNFTDEIGSILLITGLLLIAFSKERDEDERIAQIRLESLLWATLVNAFLIMLCIIFFYSDLFLKVMAYNICSTLIFFVIRFNVTLFFERRKVNQEKL